MTKKHVIGFHQQDAEEPEKKEEKKQLEPDVTECLLDAYFMRNDDSGRWTSQDICDNLRETARISPDEVTAYMLKHGYRLERDYDRLVWVKNMI